MKDSENLYDKIRELIGTSPGSVNIMDDIIDVDLQVEYFEYSKRISTEFDGEWALDQIDLLQDSDYPLKGKKQILTRLASMEDVSAYRAIETYAGDPDKGLRDWSILALQESRMHLESHFLEENQVFISTGLGGRGNKLRYFVVLIARDRRVLTDFQKKIIQEEFPYVLKKYEGEVEEIDFSGYLTTMLLLIPIQHPINDLFSEGILECNQYGDFLHENCIATNVKKLSFEEVEAFIEKRQTGNDPGDTEENMN
ncbi:MAG: hypothetical protein WD577_13505 [Bacteroidales bacterium]